MRFLIYIPNHETGGTMSGLYSVGLGDLARGVDSRVVESGPDGGHGLLCGWLDSTQNQFDYFPEKQTWLKSVKAGDREAGAYWVGLWNDSAPTEADLRRPDMRKGAQVVLGNGESWSIASLGTLDRFPKLNEDGSLTWCVDEKFNWLTTDLEQRKSTGVTEGKDTITMVFDDETDFFFLCRLLQINYRVTPEVVAHLKLLSQNAIREMVAALMGLSLKE